MLKAAIIPVILSGGAGTRLWPLSRHERPKQVLALGGADPLIAATVKRTAGHAGFGDPIIVAGAAHSESIAEALGALPYRCLILEPAARNTAPAIALAAHEALAADADAVMIVMPSDHRIADADAFRRAVAAGLDAALAGELVTFGIQPTRPETGFGYIEAAGDLAPGVKRVAAFHEKPDAGTAAAYVASGRFYWNAGIFLFRAAAYLNALARHAPAIAAAAQAAHAGAARQGRDLRPDAAAFARSPSQSIDYAVMEPEDRRAVVPVDMGWSDIGSFAALYDELRADSEGNAVEGAGVVLDGGGNLLWSEGGATIAALGVENLVIVATADAVLVIPRERSQEVKRLVEAVEEQKRRH